jgi:class 3 adenylate cyclase
VELEQKILKAILVADLQQYTRLIAADEADTLEYVAQCFQLFQEHCEPFGAEFVKTTGDGVLILFDSASSAVDYARSGLAPWNRSVPATENSASDFT